jgi:hypothetical protein
MSIALAGKQRRDLRLGDESGPALLLAAMLDHTSYIGRTEAAALLSAIGVDVDALRSDVMRAEGIDSDALQTKDVPKPIMRFLKWATRKVSLFEE